MIKKIFLILIVLYVLVLLGFYFFQNIIVFRQKKTRQNYTYTFNQKFEEVNLKTEDNAVLNAIHFKVENSKGVILYFHGNKDNLKRWGEIAGKLTIYGYDVFVVDYRGYGKSTGKKIEILMYNDAQLCYNYVKQHYNEESIVVYGRSLGGTFATYVASRNKPKQLILEATFSSMQDVVAHKLPILPYDQLLKFKFKSFEFIEKVTVPTLIFHGTKDKLVPLDLAEKLFEHSNKNLTDFVKIKGGTHHNISRFEDYNKILNTLFK